MRVSPAPPLTAGTNPPHPPHSPHMSPAVGGPGSVVMPPHPGSGQSDGRSGNMHTPGYPPGAGPPHMPSGPPTGPHNYSSKIGHIPPGAPPGPSYGQPTYQGGHQYPAVRAQGPIMQPYPQNFPPGAPQSSQGSPSPMPPGPQYPPRPPHNNHVPPNAPYGYPPFGPQGWGAQGPPGPGMSSSMMPGAPSMAGKGGPVQMPSQVGQPGSSVSGPRPHTPPHTHYLKHMPKYSTYTGPQMYPNGPGMAGLPPGGPNSSRESPQNNMPPPTSTPQPLTPSGAPLDSADHASAPSTALSNSNPPSIGPDGNPVVDEASQQSTVSNNSAASGEDRSVTPKPHKEGPLGGPTMPSGMGSGQHPPSHPPTPINSASSPGAVSMNSQQDEFETVNSPGWPRSPSTQTPGENLARLYEMSDSPERRAWLDKLLAFMDDNKTPITACPTISKNPLDLYALYLHVRERGGFVEVTKNKQWKDVAAVMGIGASSSGSYTLRKHYMKHILAYECKFDRGGVDPQPIINQIETAAKKKTTKTISVPSPGSSNSQDSFPPSNSSSLDGFSNGPHVTGAPGVPGPYPQYPPSSEYGSHLPQRQPTQATAGYQGYQGGQYHGYQGMQPGYTQPGYPNSGYPPDGRGYPPPGPPNHQGSYQGSYQQPGGYQRPAYTQGQPAFQQDQYPGMGTSGSSYGNSQLAKQLLNPPRSAAPIYQAYQGGSMYPPQKSGSAPSPGPPGPAGPPTTYTGPRRHPDFEKTQPPGWRTNSQYPGFAGQSQAGPPQQPWSRPNDSTPPGAPAAQWSQPRFPGAQPQFPTAVSGRGWSGGSFTQNVGPRVQGPGGKQNYLVPPGSSFKCGGLYGYTGKHQFPLDSVEAVLPVLARRKRMTRTDLPTCDPWRLLMSLRCGLAAEVTWALDVLNILLFDDQTVVYFGLHHMPGLLEALIEHLRRGLINMFDICSELELGRDDEATGANKRVKAEQHDQSDRPWYLRPPPSPTLDLDLGRLEDDDPANKEEVLRGAEDFTLITKTGKSVKFVRRDGELFLREGVREWDKWEGFSSGVDTWSVGGGECTAHIICTMQSSVPPLAFTRLLPGKDGKVDFDLLLPRIKEEVKEEVKEEKMDLQEEGAVKKVKVREETMEQDQDQDQEDKEKMEAVRVKEEPEEQPSEEMETEEEEASTTTNSTPKPPPPPPPLTKKDRVADLLAEMKEKRVVKMEDLAREKCDNSKDNKATFGSRVNRVNNSGKSKLDEIFKRFSKEPQDSHTGDNKKAAKETSSSNGGTAAKKDSEPLSAQPQPPSQQQPQSEQDSNSSSNNNNSSSNNNNNSTTNNNSSSSSSSSIGGTTAVVKQEQVNSEPSLAEKRPEEQAVSVLAKRSAPKERLERRESGSSRRDSGCFKRPHEDLEEESWSPDEASLSTTTEGQDWLARRVICVGTVIRNLSFIPGNEDIMSKSASLLALLGKTILLHHDHPRRTPSTAHYDRDEEADLSDWCSSLAPDTHWWWPYLHHVHENTLVTLANMAGNLDLSVYPEEISRPLLNGLLHWATCPASYGQDPFLAGGTSPQSSLSPQRLALEALVKLCVLDQNTDLVLATPPFTRLDNLCGQLTRFMCRGEDQVLREFSINLLHYFSAADSGVARVIAMQNGCVSLLVAFIEEAEAAAMNVANVQGVSALKENPELMGTSLDMVRRSANTLVHLSRVPANARVISGTENRLLTLVMSQILDTYVASQLSQVLFNVAHLQGEVSDSSPSPSPPSSPTSAQVSDASSTATLPPLPLPLPIPMSALPPVSLPVPPPVAAPVATPAPAPATPATPASAPATTSPAPTTGLTTATTTTPTSTPALTSTSAPTTTTTTTTTTPTPATAPDAPTDPKSPAADAPSNSTPASTPAATPVPATNPAPSSPTPAQAPAPTPASAPVVNHDSAAPAESEKSSNASGSPGPEPTTTQPPSSPTTTTTTNTTTPSTLSSTTTTTIATTTTATTTTTTSSLPTASLSLGKHSSLSPPNPAPSLHLTSQMAPLPVKAPSAPPTQTTNSESTSKCESLAAAATVEPPAANSSS